MIDHSRRPAFLILTGESTFQSLSPPHTPAKPFTPIIFSPSPLSSTFEIPPLEPPCQPLPWLWSCHICNTRYTLGTTRRCLLDGHYFCAGETPSRKYGKKKQHRPCGSEFDYVGWTEYGDWRRGVKDLGFEWQGEGKNCADYCNFPSECRWTKKLKRQEMERELENARMRKDQTEPDSSEDQDIQMGEVETIDPSVLQKQEEGSLARPVSASSMLEKVVKSAEKRSAGLKKALLSASSSLDITDQQGDQISNAPATGSRSLQRGMAKMAVICRIPETLYE